MNHARTGEGKEVDVPLDTIDLSEVSTKDFDGIGSHASINLGGEHFADLNDAMVHGSVELELIDVNTVQITPNSSTMFDFNMRSWNGNIIRNIKTLLLESMVSQGNLYGYKPFNINYTVTAKIRD